MYEEGISTMMFEKRKEERRKQKAKTQRNLAERLYKFIFLLGVGIAFKGLKAWVSSKKKRMG